MLKRILLALLITTLSAGTACAAAIDLGFNDNSFQLEYEQPLRSDNYGTSLGSARFLYNDDEETVLGSVGFDFVGEPGNVPGLDLGVGAEIYGGETDDNQDFINLGITGRFAYAPPRLGGFGISGRLAYAPEIFSFLDAERLLEADLRLTYAVLPKVRVYLGYQNIRMDFEDTSTWTIDEAVRVGFIGYF